MLRCDNFDVQNVTGIMAKRQKKRAVTCSSADRIVSSISTQTDVDEMLLCKILPGKITTDDQRKRDKNALHNIPFTREKRNISQAPNTYSTFVKPITRKQIASSTLSVNDIGIALRKVDKNQPDNIMYCRKSRSIDKSMSMIINVDSSGTNQTSAETNKQHKTNKSNLGGQMIPVVRDATSTGSLGKEQSLHMATILEQEDDTPTPEVDSISFDTPSLEALFEQADMEAPSSDIRPLGVNVETQTSYFRQGNVDESGEENKVPNKDGCNKQVKIPILDTGADAGVNGVLNFNIVKIGKARRVFIDTHFH